MKIDLYRRPEVAGQFSYMVVPQGRPIPAEATNTDWQTVERALDLERNNQKHTGLGYEDATEQINQKGYAISSVDLLDDMSQLRH